MISSIFKLVSILSKITCIISSILKILFPVKICFAAAFKNSLWVLILPISCVPYDAGYVVPSLLCLKRTNCSALSPSNS